MKLQDLQDDYLLNNEGVVWITEDIDSDTLERVTAQIYYLKSGLTAYSHIPRLYIRSNGGDSRTAIAIANMIKRHGSPYSQGWLVGDSASSAATIWAACPHRVAMPNTRLGIHPVLWQENYAKYDTAKLMALRDEFEEADRTQCKIYAAASNKDFDWWWTLYNQPGDVKWLTANKLVEIGMAEPYAEKI